MSHGMTVARITVTVIGRKGSFLPRTYRHDKRLALFLRRKPRTRSQVPIFPSTRLHYRNLGKLLTIHQIKHRGIFRPIWHLSTNPPANQSTNLQGQSGKGGRLRKIRQTIQYIYIQTPTDTSSVKYPLPWSITPAGPPRRRRERQRRHWLPHDLPHRLSRCAHGH
jgi:hypothetical protein